MRELTIHELDSELAEQLPARELMCCCQPPSCCSPCCPPPPCIDVCCNISACVSLTA
jgi:hypothetical protein